MTVPIPFVVLLSSGYSPHEIPTVTSRLFRLSVWEFLREHQVLSPCRQRRREDPMQSRNTVDQQRQHCKRAGDRAYHQWLIAI